MRHTGAPKLLELTDKLSLYLVLLVSAVNDQFQGPGFNPEACCSVRTVLLSIQSLLGEPNNDSPLNSYAAKLWDNQEEYKRVLSKKYAESQK